MSPENIGFTLLICDQALLSRKGYFYLVALGGNDPKGIAERAESELGLTCNVRRSTSCNKEQD